MKFIIDIPESMIKEAQKYTVKQIESVCGMPMKEQVLCAECRWWENAFNGFGVGYCHNAEHCDFSKGWNIQICRVTKQDFYCGDARRREE